MVRVSSNTRSSINVNSQGSSNVSVASNTNSDINTNQDGNSQRARSWAVGEGLIDGVDYSAKHYAQDAKESAEQASGGVEAITEAKEQALSTIDDEKTSALSDIDTEKTSAIAEMETARDEKIGEIEDTAADFEDDLEAFATRAETAATNAETSKTNAATSATSASTSATNASNSATSASTSATNAAASANLALGYKNDADTSADLAGQYKTDAEQAKTDAQYYRTQAWNYATQANTLATNAATSATSAARAQTAAENARDAAEGYAQQAEQAKDDIEAELDNYVPNTRKVNNKPLSTDITLTSSDIGALANTTKYGYSVALSLDTTNYKLTLTLKDQDGTALSTKTVDFPIESVVVNGSYDSTNQKIVLTLQSGSTIDIPVGDLISGLQSEITSTNKLDADLVDDTNSSHKFATAAQLSQIATNTSSISNLATVATSGSYSDLSNKPTIPTDTNDLTNGAGYITGITSSDVTTALGYTPYNSTNPSGYITNSALSDYVTNTSLATTLSDYATQQWAQQQASALATSLQTWVGNQGYLTGITSGDVTSALGYTPYNSTNPNGYTTNVGTVTSVNNTQPDSSGNVTITIPTVNNATLTIQKNGTTVKTFTANASSNVTANITVPTKTSDITNDSGYITSSALSPYALSSSLATVATSGSYNDLSNKPTIPDAQVQADWDVTDTTSKAYIKNKPYIPSGVVVDQTYDGTSANAQSGVAISGELTNYIDKTTAYQYISSTKYFTNNSDLGFINGASIECSDGCGIHTITDFWLRGQSTYFHYPRSIVNNENGIVISKIGSTQKTDLTIDGNKIYDADTGLIPDARINSKLIDGQWVDANEAIISSNTSLSGSTALTKRITLPDDGHTYEVLIRGSIYTSSTSGKEVFLKVKGNEDSYDRYIARCITRTSSAMYASGTTLVTASYVASNQTNLTIARESSWGGNCSELTVVAYRRIGTNT